ncbi:MAG: FtsX-like permease family protein [bacterium]|nr:FtsX-like permease family protein [bacterium]
MLNRMLRRDLWHLRGQVIAAALVVACGIGTLVATRSTYHSLVVAQADYYSTYRFADVFAHLKRAPESLAADIGQIPGVAAVHTRVVMDVSLDVPGLAEPATGRLVSVPGIQTPMLNDLYLLRGRYVDATRTDEVLASEAFANANRLAVGAHIGAVLNGRWKQLTVVGIALSPEYVYEVGNGMLFPDNKRFGVLWMNRAALAPAFSMEGAFNDVSLSLGAGAEEAEVIARLDRLLERYGGLSACGRAEQLSHRFLADELGEIRIMTTFIPSLFLGVAAFLLYVVLSRLVAMQRSEIGLLKAFGYGNYRIGSHYLAFAVVTSMLGLALGLPLGLYLGSLLVNVYAGYFHFPHLVLIASPGLLLFATLASLLAAGIGALSAVRRAVALPPAEAMRPEPPARFHAGLLEHAGLMKKLPASVRMIVRGLARKPVKVLLSVLGIALAVGLMVVGRFTLDAVNHMMFVQFNVMQHDDVTVLYNEPRNAGATFEIRRLPGVMRAEPFRLVPVWLRHENFSKRVEITGLAPDMELRRLVDKKLRPVELPPEGLLLGTKLARILGVVPGDSVSMAVLEGSRPTLNVPVAGVVDEMLGLGAYMDTRALARLLHEDRSVSGAYVQLDARREDDAYAQLKRMPAVAGVAVRGAMQQSIRDAMDRSFTLSTGILTAFACVIVVGMVYNSVRIALSERGNELASLRVLGFTRREVTMILLGEQGVLTALAIPLGLLIGYGLCALLVPVFDREMFRLPLVVGKWTFLYPAVTALLAAVLSGLLVARHLRHLDLIAVLKTRE